MKISVKEVLLESLRLYKRKFMPLLRVSLIITSLSLLFLAASYILTLIKVFPAFKGLIKILSLSLFLIFVVFVPKVSLTLRIMLNAFFAGQALSFKEAYYETDGKYWTTIYYYLIIGLLYIPAVAFTMHLKNTGTSSSTISIFNVAYSVPVSTIIFNVFSMIAIEPKTRHYIKKSFRLSKGNLMPMLFLVVAISAVTNVFGSILPQYALTALHNYGHFALELWQVRLVTSTAFGLFTQPLSDAMHVTVYRRLTIRKEEAAIA